jgi:hypothetical protein
VAKNRESGGPVLFLAYGLVAVLTVAPEIESVDARRAGSTWRSPQ